VLFPDWHPRGSFLDSSWRELLNAADRDTTSTAAARPFLDVDGRAQCRDDPELRRCHFES